MNASELTKAIRNILENAKPSQMGHVGVRPWTEEKPDEALEFINAYVEYQAANEAFDSTIPATVQRFNQVQQRVKAADKALADFTDALHERWAKEDAEISDDDSYDDDDMPRKLEIDEEERIDWLLENDPEALDDIE